MDNYLKSSLNSPLNNESKLKVINSIKLAEKRGMLHILYSQYDKQYGYSQNILIPNLDDEIQSENYLIIINNPEDAQRLAEKHVKKSPYLKKFVYDSIISTSDNNHWGEQRCSYQPAFSVENQLKKIIPISNARAIYSLDYLFDYKKLCDTESSNIYSFF